MYMGTISSVLVDTFQYSTVTSEGLESDAGSVVSSFHTRWTTTENVLQWLCIFDFGNT